MLCWIRQLQVVLTSQKTKNKIIIGDDDSNLTMKVNIYKYMAPLKDNATIKITNLSYDVILQIMTGQYYDVEVWAGYKNNNKGNNNLIRIFNGGVIYISNGFQSDRDNTVIISCGSKLVARYGQKRMNLTLNSGINMYAAIKYICLKNGIRNSNISTQLKRDILNYNSTINKTAGSYFQDLINSNSDLIVNSDSSESGSSIVSIFNAKRSNNRVFQLDSKLINLNGGYPTFDESGLKFSMLPTFNLNCGDVIKLDNSLINLGNGSNYIESAKKGYLIDKEGYYMVTEIVYDLENRGNTFNVDVNCKSRNLVSNYIQR